MKIIKIHHLYFQYYKVTIAPISLNRTFLMKLDVKKIYLIYIKKSYWGETGSKVNAENIPAVD